MPAFTPQPQGVTALWLVLMWYSDIVITRDLLFRKSRVVSRSCSAAPVVYLQ